jgi:hypothetical protein
MELKEFMEKLTAISEIAKVFQFEVTVYFDGSMDEARVLFVNDLPDGEGTSYSAHTIDEALAYLKGFDHGWKANIHDG